MNEAGYSYIKAGNDYEFYTAYGAAYAVSFREVKEYFSGEIIRDFVYRIDVEQLDPGPYNNLDFRISITVAEIIFDFFDADNRRVLFYICDPTDGKLKARKRKFDYWYRSYSNADFIKLSAVIHTADVTIDFTFIFLKNNPFAFDIPLMIDAAKDSFNNK